MNATVFSSFFEVFPTSKFKNNLKINVFFGEEGGALLKIDSK